MDTIKLKGFREGMEKEAYGGIIGAGVGGFRSSELSPEEKQILKSRNALSPDADLMLRNAGRGFLGGTGGAIAGGVLGALGGGMPGAYLGGALGTAAGSYLSTNKYSKGRAQELKKTAMEKKSDAIIGGITGAVRASNLSEAEKQKLKNEYGMSPNSNLAARNAGRGFLGGAAGGIVGGIAGSAVGGNKASQLGGALLGGIGGLYASTNKYSKGRVRKLEKEGSLSKEAAGSMAKKVIKELGDIAKGKQAREGFASGKNIAQESVRKGDATKGMQRGMELAKKKTLGGAAKTVGLYGTGAAGVSTVYNAHKD